MRRTACVAALALLAGCKGSPSRSAAPELVLDWQSPAVITLRIGDEVRIDSALRLGFVGVLQDSRCPTDVVCVWAGDGVVELSYAMDAGSSVRDTLHTTLEPKVGEFLNFVVTLLGLSPHPGSTDPIPARDYSVRLRVDRVQR